MTNIPVTAEVLRELLRYEPTTGVFTWRRRDRTWFTRDRDCNSFNAKYAGKVAGRVRIEPDGYTHFLIGVLRRDYRAGPLAWLYMTGEWPIAEIDHKDVNALNNQWQNIRLASDAEQASNRGLYKNNTTGFKGVSRSKTHGYYRAMIYANNKAFHLGYFKLAKEAAEAYRVAALTHHGQFARTE